MKALKEVGIQYKWGFPFKLIFTYASRTYTVRTEQEAKEFQEKLQRENKRDGVE